MRHRGWMDGCMSKRRDDGEKEERERQQKRLIRDYGKCHV